MHLLGYPARPSLLCDSPSTVKALKRLDVHIYLHTPTISCRSSLCFIAKVPVILFQKDYSFVKMSAFVFLLFCTIIPHVCAAPALPPAWTTVPDQSQPRLPPLNAQHSPMCVEAAQNPNWAGAIDPKDCADAIGRLWDRVLPYGYTQWTFWASSVE